MLSDCPKAGLSNEAAKTPAAKARALPPKNCVLPWERVRTCVPIAERNRVIKRFILELFLPLIFLGIYVEVSRYRRKIARGSPERHRLPAFDRDPRSIRRKIH